MNDLGKLLLQVKRARDNGLDKIREKLWDSHAIPYEQRGTLYKMDEEEFVRRGREVTEVRLWKLVDAAILELEPNVKVEIQEGRNALRDFHTDESHPHFIPEEVIIDTKDTPLPETPISDTPKQTPPEDDWS